MRPFSSKSNKNNHTHKIEGGGLTTVKIFKVKGELKKDKRTNNFTTEIRALTKEHALEAIYRNMGSRHNIKQRYITITDVQETSNGDIS